MVSRGLSFVGLVTLLCFVLPACADSAKSVNSSASNKPTLSANEDESSAPPLYVGVTEGSQFVPGWMKELSLSESQFSMCWQFREPGDSWVVIESSWLAGKGQWEIKTKSVKGHPRTFVTCVEREFSNWIGKRKGKKDQSARFYLVEKREQLGRQQSWPEGADRYRWFGQVEKIKDKRLRVYQ